MKSTLENKTSSKRTAAKNQTRRLAQSRKRKQRRILWIAAIVSVIAVAGLVIFLFVTRQPAVGQIDGVQIYDNLSREHVTGTINYPQVPPVGGQHNAVWLNCGVYTQPVPNENAVHSLEHGAIWITYQPNLPADQLQKLQAIVKASNYRILSPYPGIPSPIVATAWGAQLKLNSASDPRLMVFIQKYQQNGPEQGAPCDGGTGTPQ